MKAATEGGGAIHRLEIILRAGGPSSETDAGIFCRTTIHPAADVVRNSGQSNFRNRWMRLETPTGFSFFWGRGEDLPSESRSVRPSISVDKKSRPIIKYRP